MTTLHCNAVSVFGSDVDRLAVAAKPVLVTEFGCCSYRGADRRGAAGDAIVDWRDPGEPRIRGSHQRDEAVQARYIGELLDEAG